ncbi:MAG TPA: ATP synthase F1 subunit delta [Bacteroidales bacterium]|nr:ATP synthase F1 subunit delta [Bacteroidales bacterium]HPT03225.1 ATP synthase F1 subunit delta [Bacteroidales bacterium]
MSYTKITVRYAKALFDLALDNDLLERVEDDMALIDTVCHENKALVVMLHNPVISADKKQKVLSAIFSGNIHPLTMNFLSILSRKRREQYIDGIADAFVKIYRDYKGITVARVTGAMPLDASEKQTILGILSKLTDKDVELIETIRTEILGGFIIQMDDYQIDQSVVTKIKNLKKDFEKNPYIKGF